MYINIYLKKKKLFHLNQDSGLKPLYKILCEMHVRTEIWTVIIATHRTTTNNFYSIKLLSSYKERELQEQPKGSFLYFIDE